MGYHPYDMKDMEKELERKRKNNHIFKRSICIISIFILCVIIGYLIDMNFVARKFGGEITINLQENQKLVRILLCGFSLVR